MSRNRKIIAFTGAGISKESGIDTFMERPQVRDCLHRHVANLEPERYKEAIKLMKDQIDQAQPNDAHLALSEYNIDVITMNIDGLHQKAGSHPICLHGSLPSDEELDNCDKLYNKPVLYGDMAPQYQVALEKVSSLSEGDVLLVIGASDSTAISVQLQMIAQSLGAQIIQIQSNAKHQVRKVLEEIC